MKALPIDIGIVHFVGIGGIGMSGIAEVLHSLGYEVQGSDVTENSNVTRLRKLAIPIKIKHDEENLGRAKVVVVSTAIKADNPEVIAARNRFIPVVQRAEMLGELMRLKWSISVGGTHGKTTTSSLIAHVLDHAGLDPTVINGGIINSLGTNIRLGQSDWIIAEADESDGTFLKLPSTIAVVTNVDPEHLDFYGSFEKLRDAFDSFVLNIPFYGFAVLCIDHPEVQAMISRLSDRRIVTFGFNPQADFRAVNYKTEPDGSRFDCVISDRKNKTNSEIKDLFLPMFGKHNVQNTLAAIAIASEMRVAGEIIKESLNRFKGVSRRFTKVGEVSGVTIIDDYGHHPVEISAVLGAARQATTGRVIAVMQPHRYTRLQTLFDGFCTCFNDADIVYITDIFAAGEQTIGNLSKEILAEGVRYRGHRHVEAVGEYKDLVNKIYKASSSGDIVVFLGAGDITKWAARLPDKLRAIKNEFGQLDQEK